MNRVSIAPGAPPKITRSPRKTRMRQLGEEACVDGALRRGGSAAQPPEIFERPVMDARTGGDQRLSGSI